MASLYSSHEQLHSDFLGLGSEDVPEALGWFPVGLVVVVQGRLDPLQPGGQLREGRHVHNAHSQEVGVRNDEGQVGQGRMSSAGSKTSWSTNGYTF